MSNDTAEAPPGRKKTILTGVAFVAVAAIAATSGALIAGSFAAPPAPTTGDTGAWRSAP